METQLISRLKEVLKDYNDISLDYVVEQVRATLKKRLMKAFHVNKHIPNGYEDQGAFNLIIMTAGHTLFDCVVGEEYFRYDAINVKEIERFRSLTECGKTRSQKSRNRFSAFGCRPATKAISPSRLKTTSARASKISPTWSFRSGTLNRSPYS